MYHRGENNLIKLTHYDGTKKRAHDSQIAKENLKLSQDGPSCRYASGIKVSLILIKELRALQGYVGSLKPENEIGLCPITSNRYS